MSLSVRTRFEVLKRDRFTCSYCGKHPPEVLLEVDHIHPVAAGGTDDLDNLTTACTDCNRGKSARLLDEGTAPAINRSAVAEMQERIDQAKAYMETLGALRSITDDQVQRVTDAWAEAYGAITEERDDGVYWTFANYPYGGRWPEKRSIRSFLRKLDLGELLDAVDITRSRIPSPGGDAVRYFYGVCHHSIREGKEPLSRTTGNDEVQRIGALLRNYSEYGYESLEQAVLAIFPDLD